MQRRQRASIIGAVLVASTLLLAACGGGGSDSSTQADTTSDDGGAGDGGGGDTSVAPASGACVDTPEMQELVAAAEAEGALRFDSVDLDEESQNTIDAFMEAYPAIDVTYRRNSAAPMRAIEEQEIAAGQEQFDVLGTSNSADFVTWAEQGRLLPLTDLPSYDSLPDGWGKETSVIVYIGPMGVTYNTDLVSEDELPTSYEDLASEEWDGRLGVSDPLNAGSVAVANVSLYQSLGEDLEWFETIGGLSPTLSKNSTEAGQALAAGETELMVIFANVVAANLRDQGAPLGVVPLPDTPTFPGELAVYAEAENPNAAKLFIEWNLCSAEADEIKRDNIKIGAQSLGEVDFGSIHPILDGFDGSMFRTVEDPMDVTPELLDQLAQAQGF